MPALETLSHLVPSVLQEPRWPHIFSDTYSSQTPESPIEVPQLQRLSVEYDILDPSRPLAHLAHLVFPNLSELRITYTPHHAWYRDPEREADPHAGDREWYQAERAPFPPPLFQPLFHQRTFTALTSLHLAHARIDVPRMCEFLLHCAPVLEILGLEDCGGAGEVVCALGSPAEFDVCLHGHAYPLDSAIFDNSGEDVDGGVDVDVDVVMDGNEYQGEDEDEDEDLVEDEDEDVDEEDEDEGEDEDENEDERTTTTTTTTTRTTPSWLALRIHTLVLVDCADVRIDCLRKLIATRAAAALGVHDVPQPQRASWSACTWRREEDAAVRGWTPRRIERLCVERCAMVTEGGVNMLSSLAGAPQFSTRDGGRAWCASA